MRRKYLSLCLNELSSRRYVESLARFSGRTDTHRAQVDGDLWDLERPLEKSCSLQLLDFEHPEGKRVFWHSSAHVLGEAAERHYGCHLCIGPPTDDGFFYEMAIEDRAVSSADYPALEKVSELAVKQKQKFERLVVPKETLLEMFAVRPPCMLPPR